MMFILQKVLQKKSIFLTRTSFKIQAVVILKMYFYCFSADTIVGPLTTIGSLIFKITIA